MIKEKNEERNKMIKEEKGVSKKQRINQKLAQRKEEKKNKKIIEKGEREIEGIKKKVRTSKGRVPKKKNVKVWSLTKPADPHPLCLSMVSLS